MVKVAIIFPIYIYIYIYIYNAIVNNKLLVTLHFYRVSVSRCMRPFAEESRPPEFYSQKVSNFKIVIKFRQPDSVLYMYAQSSTMLTRILPKQSFYASTHSSELCYSVFCTA